MSQASPDYSRYFTIKQRAYLIALPENRESTHYESLSGTIVGRHHDVLELQIPYPTELPPPENGAHTTTYKITTESLGVGLQIVANLIKVAPGNIFHLKLLSILEIFQRRQMPRIDTPLRLFHLRRDSSLGAYRKEFKRLIDYRDSHGSLPSISLQETQANLSVGGISIALPSDERIVPLSLFIFELDPAQPPVCAVAETVWNRRADSVLLCGYRFVHILKADQERINSFVQTIMRTAGVEASPPRNNWELLDRMTVDASLAKR